MTSQKIYLRKVRDFGEVFGATFTYIKQHFKHFFGSIILLAGPFALVSGICTADMVSSITSSSLYNGSGLNMFGLSYFIMLLAGILGQTVYTTVINQHLILNERMDASTRPTISDIARSFFKVYWKNLLAWFMLLIFIILFAIAIGIIVFIFIGIGSLGAGILMAILGIFAYIGLIFIVMPVFGYLTVTSLHVVQRDDINFFDALGKVYRYMKGQFWMTWLLAIVSFIVTYLTMIIAIMPTYIVTVISMFSRMKDYSAMAAPESEFSVTGYIMWSISYLLIFCVFSIFHLMCTFQYNSLEEKKEGKSILEKINAIS
jgi:hypothetical protein